jgi:16S rRNA (uracil1498-N3)-methyltransferase
MAEPRLMDDRALGAGVRLTLTEAQSRHAGAVLRLGAGASLRLFNPRDGEWRARIVEKSKRELVVELEDFLRAPVAPPDLLLLFAPVKRHATDLIIEKATELGAARIQPVLTARTIAETVRIERLAAIAREAAEQAERFEAPEILPPAPLAKALETWDATRPLIYADESGDDEAAPWGGSAGRARPMLEALTSPSLSGRRGKRALLIGPEGGFSPEERRALRALPFVTPVSLGPRILRAETAAIVALAVIQAAWGDWRD